MMPAAIMQNQLRDCWCVVTHKRQKNSVAHIRLCKPQTSDPLHVCTCVRVKRPSLDLAKQSPQRKTLWLTCQAKQVPNEL